MGTSSWYHAPPEIMSQIFEITLPEDLEASLPVPTVPPLLLTHVCSLWRAVTHNTPKLWLKCNLRCNSLSVTNDRQTKERLAAQAQLWLQHSGNRGVSLGLRFPPDYEWHLPSSQREGWLHDIFTLLTSGNPFADRVRGLDIVWPCSTTATLPGFIEALPRLEAFSIDFPGGYDSLCRDHGVFAISSSQLLRRLHIGRTTQVADTPPQSVYIDMIPHWPWKHLTHLSLVAAALSETQGHKLLQLCGNLEKLSLCIQSMNLRTRNIEDVDIALPFLHSLDIRFTFSPTFRIFNLAKLPALQKLTVRAWDLDEEEGQQPGPEFLAQLTGLRSLSLHSEDDISKPLFRKFLRAAPNLLELSVATEYFLELKHVFKRLTVYPHRQRTHILPNLRTISIYCTSDDSGGWTGRRRALRKLKDMADSRAQTVPPCTVSFVLADDIEWQNSDFDSESEGDKDDMKDLLGPSGVSKKRHYLYTAYYDPGSRPPDFPTSLQRNPAWTASEEAFDS